MRIKMLKKKFQLVSKVDKGKSELKLKKSIAESVKLKNEKIAEIYCLSTTLKTINTQVICIKNYARQKAKK